MSKLDQAIYPLLPNSQYLLSDEAKEAKVLIQKLMLELLRDTITESSDVAEIGEIFAKKVGEL